MNSPRSIRLLNEIGPSVSTASSGDYFAAQGNGVAPILVGILSAVVAIGLAVTGWKLKRNWRRRDNQREDLTYLAQLVRTVRVHLQLLADQDCVATVTDCRPLRTLKFELGGSDAAFAPDAVTAVANVIKCINAVLETALPVPTTAGTSTLVQARAQGLAVQEALAATTTAQAVISRLRAR